MFNNDPQNELRVWLQTYLVNPIHWDCPHPVDFPPDRSRRFQDYIADFEELGYRVRDINRPVGNASSFLTLIRQTDGKKTNISGRADYVVCTNDCTPSDFMYKAVCVIVIQSNDDIERCELQILTYLFLLMNTKGLSKLVGFLVLRDGNCRAYKATRENGNCMYEENDLFHVSYIAEVFASIF